MQQNQHSPPTPRDNSTILYFIATLTFFSLIFLLSLFSSTTSSSSSSSPDPHLFPNTQYVLNNPNSSPLPKVSSIAYFITGSSGDSSRIFRLLLSIYHPKNLYRFTLTVLPLKLTMIIWLSEFTLCPFLKLPVMFTLLVMLILLTLKDLPLLLLCLGVLLFCFA